MMLGHAEAVNARLRKVYPKGFALDATHRPHITLIQRFVRTADLDEVYTAAGQVLSSADVTARYAHLSPTHLHQAVKALDAGGRSDGRSSAHSGSSGVTHTATNSAKS